MGRLSLSAIIFFKQWEARSHVGFPDDQGRIAKLAGQSDQLLIERIQLFYFYVALQGSRKMNCILRCYRG